MSTRTIRVFPRRTNATPTDDLARIGLPLFWDEADRVEVSVSFTWDIPRAELLAKEWTHVAPTTVGGPAFDDPGGEFVPGKFLQPHMVITSRGCPNHCWFCEAWKREGSIRELTIHDGWIVQDNNLLACSDAHVGAVFDMLARQPQRPHFSGGLEAANLKLWHVKRLAALKPRMMWFAYDTPDDLEPLRLAARMLKHARVLGKSHNVGCYVLCGYNRSGHVDSIAEATERLETVVRLGYFPQAMLMDRGSDWPQYEMLQWRRFARSWAAKQIVGSQVKRVLATREATS